MMDIVVKNAKNANVSDLKEKQIHIEEMAMKAYRIHQEAFEVWREGEPVKAWIDADGYICVKYSSGNWWHYKDLDLPFPSWW